MFLFSIEMKYMDIAGWLLSILHKGFPSSLFIEKHFDETIDRQYGYSYQTLFWTRLNKWIPSLQ
jgi:hypothetical protein